MQQWFETPPGQYLLAWERSEFERAVGDIFGYPDDLKFHSSITLFAAAGPHDTVQVFIDALEKYFDAARDRGTLDRLAQALY